MNKYINKHINKYINMNMLRLAPLSTRDPVWCHRVNPKIEHATAQHAAAQL